MAKNYTFAEAVAIIHDGKDMESIVDIGRRYPVLMNKVTKVAALAGDAFVDLMSFMPDHLTANKVNSAMKAVVGEATEAEDVAEGTEVEANEVADTTDYESMSAKALWDLLGKAGKRKLAKSTKKADLVEACKAMDAGEDVAETVEAEVEATEADEANPYAGKTAMELFKECKKRGIKAAPKKPAKFYADLLVKDDAKTTATEETEAEAESWDDEPAEEAKSAKKEKKEKAKPAKAEAEDDDWDI